MNLIIEPDSFSFRWNRLSGGEIVYGNFYLKIGDEFYPFEHWNDFIVRLLMSWTHNLLNNERGVLPFFDGSYEVEFIKEDKIIILTIEEIGECRVEISDFYEGLSQCLTAVFEYLNKNNLFTIKYKVMQECIEQLKSFC